MSSIFSNSATHAAAEAPAYTRALLDVLGDQNPLDVLSALMSQLNHLTKGLTAEELRRPETAGKWSVLQVLDHLTDQEMVFGYRVRFVIAEDTPTIVGYDQDLWASRLRYGTADRDSLLAELGAMRTRNLRLFR